MCGLKKEYFLFVRADCDISESLYLRAVDIGLILGMGEVILGWHAGAEVADGVGGFAGDFVVDGDGDVAEVGVGEIPVNEIHIRLQLAPLFVGVDDIAHGEAHALLEHLAAGFLFYMVLQPGESEHHNPYACQSCEEEPELVSDISFHLASECDERRPSLLEGQMSDLNP